MRLATSPSNWIMSARTHATPDLARLDRTIAELRDAHFELNRKHWHEVIGKGHTIEHVYQPLTAAKERRCVALALDIQRLCETRSALFAGLLDASLNKGAS